MKKKTNDTAPAVTKVEEKVEPLTEEKVEEEKPAKPAKKEILMTEVVVNVSLLNVREKAKDGSNIVCVVPFGTKLQAKADKVNSKWYSVTTPDGKAGFVIDQFVK